MQYITLGQTGLRVSRTAFGAIPIQRLSESDAVCLLRKAYDAGINFFDTAYGYTDSETKIGKAFSGAERSKLVLATKTHAKTVYSFWHDLKTSLVRLQTDYIDLYQFHNPEFIPQPSGDDGLYHAALEAKHQGLIRHIGITNHDSARVIEAINSGLYDTVQFPFSYLASERDLAVVEASRQHNVGFIAMKAMSGGLLSNAAAAFAFIRSFEMVVPIWGIEKECELDEFLSLEETGIVLDTSLQRIIDQDRQELSGFFCRGCGYCLPCPAGIPISIAARMSFLLKRALPSTWQTPVWQENMRRIRNCTQCGACAARCPYGLKPYELLKDELDYYEKQLACNNQN